MPFQRIDAEKLSQSVVRQIEQLILRGILSPGERLPAERELAERLGVDPRWAAPAYEDIAYYLLKEDRLPVNVDPNDPKLDDPQERARMARLFERGLGERLHLDVEVGLDLQPAVLHLLPLPKLKKFLILIPLPMR